jgi:uncharacterized protein (TIGR03089 family)
VQLAPPSRPGPPPADVAQAIRAAVDLLGQRPAVTVLHPDRREEQGIASLAQWAAKGAHLLTLDLLLEPGDRLHLDAPPSWQGAAVCLAAWWAGIEVTLDGDAHVAVVHESRSAPAAADEVLWLGDALDGSPLGSTAGEAWAHAVQAFPDQPPTPSAAPDRAALRGGDLRYDQASLLQTAATLGAGTAGLESDEHDGRSPERRVGDLVAVAARPFVLHRPTVVLRGTDREAATGERVTTWL